MYRKTALPELLAPAGDMECLYAAVAAGADAIYVGGKRFGARAFAKNFEPDELASAVRYCHLHGVRLYVTINTLIEDKEMPEALEYAAQLYRMGVDALIAADIGLISAIRRYIPDMEIHASTQMSLHSAMGVDMAARLGVSRAVVARELSLGDIKAVVENSKCEIEVFLHGALCVCHSGQCLFSSMVGGRSGNRGECAQPCRLPYNNGKYPLSLKDLSLAEHIPALIESGVASLKIEGRMKSPEYVYTVTKIYRRLLDEGRASTPAENEQLRKAFSRGGFTDGYFVGNTETKMTGIRSNEDKEDSRGLASLDITKKRVAVRARVVMRLGRPAEMTLTDGKKTVTAFGAVPAVAQNMPLTADAVRERLAKMGNTNLSLLPEDIELDFDQGINLPLSAINALRRDAAEAFEDSSRPLDEIRYIPSAKALQKKHTTAQFFSEKAYLAALKADERAIEAFDIRFIPLFSSPEGLARANGVFLPPVVFDSEMDEVADALKTAKKQGIMYALVGNLAQIKLALDLGLVPIGDFRLNITNRESALAYEKMGVCSAVLSPELTLPKARDIGGGVITYGRVPLMVTERCFMRENFGCKSCSCCSLTDRKGEKFPIIREFKHRNIIFNSVLTYMGDRKEELKNMKIDSCHFIFSTEGGDEIVAACRAYRGGKSLAEKAVRRVGRR